MKNQLKHLLLALSTSVIYFFSQPAFAQAESVTREITKSVTFEEIGVRKSRRIECETGETLLSASAKPEEHRVIQSGVKLNLDESNGRAARVFLQRMPSTEDIGVIASGGDVIPIDTNVILYAECMRGINVKKYGARADGVTVDTIAIQDAIADSPANGTIYFPAGNYVIDAPLVINKRLTLIGDGYSTQIFQSNAVTDNIVITARGVKVHDIFLGSASTTLDTALLNLQGAHHADIRNVAMRGGYYGLFLNGTLSSSFTNLRSDANLGAPGFFAANQTSDNHTWVRSIRDTPNLISSNANSFFNPLLEGGKTCFHHTDFGGQGNLNIFGGTIEGCQVAGLVLEGNGAPVNVYGTHFENNYEVLGVLDVQTDTSFGVNLDGILSTGKIEFNGIGSEHSITGSKINRLQVGSEIKRTIMLGSMHSSTPPGSQIVDNSNHSVYFVNGIIQSLLSENSTTFGFRTAGQPILNQGPNADVVIEGSAYITHGVLP